MAERPFIEVTGVSHVFQGASGRQTHALEGVNLCCERGSLTSVVGPSACGKTTLLRLLINDYARVQEDSVTGEKLPTRYAFETGVIRHAKKPTDSYPRASLLHSASLFGAAGARERSLRRPGRRSRRAPSPIATRHGS